MESLQGELLPDAEVFVGTSVPRLTLDGDADWLSLLITDPTKAVDNERIDVLNKSIEAMIAEPVSQHTQRLRGISGFVPRVTSGDIKSSKTRALQAQTTFYNQIDAYNSLSPIGVEAARQAWPLTLVQVCRLMHTHVGEALPDVLQRSRFIASSSVHRVQRCIDVLEQAQLPVHKVLTEAPYVIRYVGQKPLDFVLRSAGEAVVRYDARLAAAASSLAVRREVSVVEMTDIAAERYAELSEFTNLEPGVLAVAAPQIATMDPAAFEALQARIYDLSERTEAVPLRVILRHIAEDGAA